MKPATIAGYRTAISDHLGPFGLEVGKSIHLNRLLASFYRDKPFLNRGIPSWDLSLVLMSLTKAPFEPLKDASLKILTFKTVSLMALAAGKRRGRCTLGDSLPSGINLTGRRSLFLLPLPS